MAGRLTFKEEKAFKELLYVNALRGKHGVGIGAVAQTGETLVRKRAMDVDGFLEQTPVQEIFRKQLRCLIGHNRFATIGKVNHYNAHPFEMSHVMGVHNGSLKNMKLLQDHEMFDVDSEVIYHNINELGVDETAKRLDGAWALTWWDRRDNSLHMWRNDDRPLFYVYSEDRKIIFWASELEMLYLVLNRNNIAYTKAYEVTAHKEYKFVIPLTVDQPIEDIKIRGVEAYVRPPAPVYNGYQSYQGGNFGKKQLALVTTKTTGITPTVLEVGTKVRFHIDRVNGKSADAYLMGTPVTVDTTDCIIVGISHAQKRAFNANINDEWVGIINGRQRNNGGAFKYIVQGNSVKLQKFALVENNAIMTDQASDVPEDTIIVEGVALTRREFMQEYGHCTCRSCGMDLEFETGIEVNHRGGMPSEYTCASCADETDWQKTFYGNRH